MTRPTSSATRAGRGVRSATQPAGRASTALNTKTVWMVCAAALGCAAVVAWTVHAPARQAVVLSSTAQAAALAAPKGDSAPSMAQFPGLAPSPGGSTVASPALATASLLVPLDAKAAEISRADTEPVTITAGVPVSTWPAAPQTANGVPPRSDMRYQVNAPPRR